MSAARVRMHGLNGLRCRTGAAGGRPSHEAGGESGRAPGVRILPEDDRRPRATLGEEAGDSGGTVAGRARPALRLQRTGSLKAVAAPRVAFRVLGNEPLVLLPRKLLGLIYVAIGIFVAASKDYLENLETVKRVVSAVLAILLWPLLLLGVDLHIR
jgi:hypothetical protein